jgi:PAS domain S-box-containing protein
VLGSWTVRQEGAAVRVLIVDNDGLGHSNLDGLFDPARETELVQAGSISEARELLRSDGVDLIVFDQSRIRSVLDSLFAFVGLFSLGGVVLDANEAPLTASTLPRDQVVGHRMVDLPWFAHSASERSRISDAIAAAGRGERVRLETQIRSTSDGKLICIDAAFAPLRDGRGNITHVVGSGVDISARKRAEALLAASQSRLEEAQRVAHVGSWEWRVADNRVRWSDELYRIYGLTPAEFVPTYEGFLSRVYPDDLEHTTAVIRQAVENVTPFVYDHRVRRPDGGVRMLHTRGEVIGDETGRAARLVGSCWDVTDRWEAMQKLESTVAALRATLEATADGILVGDPEGRVAMLNQRMLALWRLPSDVAAGADIGKLAENVRDQLVDPTGFMARVSELYGNADTEGFDLLRFADGRVYERYSVPQRVGETVAGRVCSFRDVTQRQRLLEEAEAARVTAEAARRDYETFLERISDGYVALDRSWRYVYVNSCAGRLLGREARSLVGKHIWTEFPEGRGQKFQRAYEDALREQRPIQIREHYPPWNRWFENRIYPSPDGVSILFTDVTAEVKAQEELKASTEQLRALAARLDAIREEERQVIAREIHDQIGQVLTAIKLDFGWLRGQLPAEAAPEVRKRAAATDLLLDQALDTARRVSTSLRPAMLDDLGLPAAVAWYAGDFEQRTGVACEVDMPADDGHISPAVGLCLFRIVQEALTNVARHAQARRVRISMATGPDAVTLTVADDGRGVTADELARPTSLGIVGMRERALVVGGEVAITGSPGCGTTLTVRVPIDGRAGP